jgi:hypothetical protein
MLGVLHNPRGTSLLRRRFEIKSHSNDVALGQVKRGDRITRTTDLLRKAMPILQFLAMIQTA